jgi:NAD(P)-dependent dehydrogenase (short-subunit alcohol dehydrogenase family)
MIATGALRRVALVTGAAQGIGRGIALRLATDGYDVAVGDLNGSTVSKVAEEIKSLGRRSHHIFADVSSEEQVKNMVDSTENELGSLDIVSIYLGFCFFEYEFTFRWLQTPEFVNSTQFSMVCYYCT